ncbi:MAG: 1-deoxy-D-xylulose-5-phosphate synthase [Chitinophagaceae bacterium]
MEIVQGEILKRVNSPNDLKQFSEQELLQYCKEVRAYIINVVSMHGGHFAASLGVVELTVAIHYIYNTPSDHLIWDVGHQAYAHKIITGRRDVFPTNRQYKGISGFPNIFESKYDAFGVGHSSTSISAGLGMALANQYQGKHQQTVIIIGDGALGAGQAFEALNHAGVANTDILIIVNDNNISIDPNVGALKELLTKLTTSQQFNTFRDKVWNVLGFIPGTHKLRQIAARSEKGIKGFLVSKSNFFESLNIRYFGPIDGHNLPLLLKTLKHIKEIPGPKILHTITTKGKGYKRAEKEQTKWHATGGFDKATGKQISIESTTQRYQDIFGKTMVELAQQNDKIFAITPAMVSGSSLKMMMEKMPNRVLDVGICEQHAVTISAGLVTQGIKVYCTIYSTFLQRAYDQVIHDVALQKIPVIFCVDRAGIVGEDGPTHHGHFDLAYMRCIPNVIVAAPINEIEFRNMLYTAQLLDLKLPIFIRYPRNKGIMVDWEKPFQKIEIGKGLKIKEGEKVAILTIGYIGNNVIKAMDILQQENIHPLHYDVRFLKPLDYSILEDIMSKNIRQIITVEDGTVVGGLGSAVLEAMNAKNYYCHITMLGMQDIFVHQGSIDQLQKDCGYDTEGIIQTVRKVFFHAENNP